MPLMPFTHLHHVQLAMPKGHEDEARRFYGDLLGMQEIPKPEPLASRGGVWFRSGNVEIHLGVEEDFRPAKKAHPALVCAHYRSLLIKMKAAGILVRPNHEIPGTERAHVEDVFGNRLELIAS